MKGRRVLVTGPAGTIASSICRQLVSDNEVWGLARFSRPGSREATEAAGVRTAVVDLGEPDFSALPAEFDHVLHLATFMSGADDYEAALRVSALGTGHLMRHFRTSGSFLVMSTTSVYRPHPDPGHSYGEQDPLGEAAHPSKPNYSISKIAEEAVARFAAEAFGIPTVLARMNVFYGRARGIPYQHLDAILAGRNIQLRSAAIRYSPIHELDAVHHLDGLLAAAAVPATVVNFGGDHAVEAERWCAYLGELVGREPRIQIRPLPGSQPGVVANPTRRIGLTGPDRIDWREGLRDMVNHRLAAASGSE